MDRPQLSWLKKYIPKLVGGTNRIPLHNLLWNQSNPWGCGGFSIAASMLTISYDNGKRTERTVG